jgi:hypothetical protein
MRSQIRYSLEIFDFETSPLSKGSGLDGMAYIGSVWQNRNGNRNVPYLNRNDSKRNLNLNWIDNDWNEIYRFAAVRNSLHSERIYVARFSFIVTILSVYSIRQAFFLSRTVFLRVVRIF